MMPRKEFKGDTLEEVRQAVERWKQDRPGTVITKEHLPVEFVYGGKHFLGKDEGPGVVIGAVIVIDYETPSSSTRVVGPDRPEG